MTKSFETPAEPQGRYKPLGYAKLAEHDDRGMRLKAGATTVEVSALARDLFRVGMFPKGKPPKYDSDALRKRTGNR